MAGNESCATFYSVFVTKGAGGCRVVQKEKVEHAVVHYRRVAHRVVRGRAEAERVVIARRETAATSSYGFRTQPTWYLGFNDPNTQSQKENWNKTRGRNSPHELLYRAM